MKFLVRTGLLIVALCGVLLLSLPFSEGGTRLLLDLAQRLAPLELEHAKGSLASRLEITRLAYTSDGLRVEVQDLATQLDLSCLLISRFCFSELNVGSLEIDLASARGDASTQDSKNPAVAGSRELFEFPVGLESDNLSVGRTSIRWQGGEWRQGAALLAVRVQGAEIAVASARLLSPELVTQPAEQEDDAATERRQLPQLRLPFRLTVKELSLQEPRWTGDGTMLELASLRLAGEWRDTNLQLSRLEVVSADLGSLAAEGEIDFAGEWPLRWAGELDLAVERTVAGFPGGPVAIELAGPPSALVARLASGGARGFEFDLKADLLDRGLPFTMGIEIAAGDPLPLSELPGVPRNYADLIVEFPLRVDAAGSLEQQRFAVEGAFSWLEYRNVALTATGLRRGEAVQFDKLFLVDVDGENRVDASGQLTLGSETVLSLVAESPGVNLPGILPMPGRLEGAVAAQARLGEGRWQLGLTDLALQGEVNGVGAKASGRLSLNQDWALADSDLEVVVNGAELRLVGANDGSGEGRVDLVVEDLGRWQADSRGSAVLRGRVSAGRQHMELRGELENVERDELSFDRAEIAGRYALDQNQFDLTIEVAPLEFGGMELSAYKLSASGNEQRQSLRIVSAGDIQTELVLTGSGWGQDWQGSLSPASLETPHGTWEMARSVDLSWDVDAAHLAVQPHCWKQPLASVCFKELRLGSTGGMGVVANGDLAAFGSLLPAGMEISGTSEAELVGSWQDDGELLFEGRTRTRSALVTRHYGDGEAATVNWDRGEGQVRYDGNEVSLKWAVQRAGRQILDIDLQMPTASDQPIDGQVSVSRLQLEPLIAFIPALSELQGELTGRLLLGGTRDKPLGNGEFQLVGGAAAVAGNPTLLRGLQLDVTLQGEKAQLRGAGVLGGGGVRLEGELALQPNLELKLEVEGERQNILYPPATQLLLSERLEIVARNGLLSVAGDITVHEGRLEPEQLPEGSVAVSSSVVEVDYRGNVIREGLPFDVSLDVRVKVEDRFKVSTSVLFATLGGELEVKQRPGQPLQLFGTLRIVDGYVSAYKQQLQIERGIFSFSGRPDNPSVNVRAVRNISGSNVVVGMQIQGTYEALGIQVFSEPPMSEGETMSYLVRGRGLESSAGEDGTALALSVAGSVINRTTLVSELNRIPGVNNVSFGADGSNDDTAATVSGFIGDRIYLSYGVGIYEPINVLIARIYLRTRLWLEVVSRLENSVDLYYAFDID